VGTPPLSRIAETLVRSCFVASPNSLRQRVRRQSVGIGRAQIRWSIVDVAIDRICQEAALAA